MTPEGVRALRCPVCGGPLEQKDRALRCPKRHSFDLAREGYVNLLAIQRRHTREPGDSREMVRARRAFLASGAYAPLMQALADVCAQLPHRQVVDAGCGEGSYDRFLCDALPGVQIVGFDLSREAVRLAAKLVPEAFFAVGGSFCAPVADGWADLLLNVFSPWAGAEFARMLRPGGVLLYAVPTPRHLFGLKALVYAHPYENAEQETDYPGFTRLGARTVEGRLRLGGDAARQLFAMTPYAFRTPADGLARLAACECLETEIGFRFLAYRRDMPRA